MNYYSIYNYSWYVIDGVKFYMNPYGYICGKIFCKDTLKQLCIVSYPYTRDMLVSKLARDIKDIELDDINKIKHV